MKKICVIIFLLLIHGKIYSLGFNFAHGFLNHYNGIMMNSESTSYYFMADLINFNIMNADSSIGLFVSPVQYSFISHPHTQLLSFINVKLYFNIYDNKDILYDTVESIIGPFFSINWMNLKNFNEFDFNSIVYSTGLLFSARTFAGGNYYDIKKINRSPEVINYFTLELGYKIIREKDYFYKDYFYAGVQIIDPLIVFASIASFIYFATHRYGP